MDRMNLTYYPTHIRMGAWIVGILTGYILHRIRDRRIILSRVCCSHICLQIQYSIHHCNHFFLADCVVCGLVCCIGHGFWGGFRQLSTTAVGQQKHTSGWRPLSCNHSRHLVHGVGMDCFCMPFRIRWSSKLVIITPCLVAIFTSNLCHLSATSLRDDVCDWTMSHGEILLTIECIAYYTGRRFLHGRPGYTGHSGI